MQLAKLKNLSRNQCREALLSGRVTEFEYMLHEYLTGEISWPVYRGKDVATLREKLNLTQKGLALLMGVSWKTVLAWENDGAEEALPSTVCITLCLISKLGADIFKLMRTDEPHFSLISRNTSVMSPASDMSEAADYCLSAMREQQKVPDTFKAEQVQTLITRLGVSRAELARTLDVSLSTVNKWASGAVEPKGSALVLLKVLWMHGFKALQHQI